MTGMPEKQEPKFAVNAGGDLMRLYAEQIQRKDLQDSYGCALHLQRMAVEIERLESIFQEVMAANKSKGEVIEGWKDMAAKQAKVIEAVKEQCNIEISTESAYVSAFARDVLLIVNAEGK